jgi:hypothetical protein
VGTLIALSDFPDRAQALNTREPLMVRSADGDPTRTEQVEMAAAGSASRMFVPLVVRENPLA